MIQIDTKSWSIPESWSNKNFAQKKKKKNKKNRKK